MAKYSVKLEFEGIIDEDFEIGKIGEVLFGKGIDTLSSTNEKWNDIVRDAFKNLRANIIMLCPDEISGNVTEIARVLEKDDEEYNEEIIRGLAEMRDALSL